MHNETDIEQSSLLPLSSTAVSVELSLEEANSSGALSFLGFCIAMIGFGVTFRGLWSCSGEDFHIRAMGSMINCRWRMCRHARKYGRESYALS